MPSFVFDVQRLNEDDHPLPSLKEGGEPYPSAPLTGKRFVPLQLLLGTTLFPDRAAVPFGFPSFLQGGDRGGSPSKTWHCSLFDTHFS
jgi:hypothetical protein